MGTDNDSYFVLGKMYCAEVNCTEGVCEDTDEGFSCVCNPGFEGEYCEQGEGCFERLAAHYVTE